jgi:hypothetical protein
MDFDWQSVVKSVAPTIATALGGPLAGMAVKAIGDSLGLDEPTQENIATALKGASPDDLLKVKQAEQDFAAKMKQLDIDVFSLEVKDRDSARKAAVDGGTAKMLFWLSLFLLVVCLGSEIAVLFLGYPKTVPEIVVGRILGLLDAVTMMVLAFWYGTTSQSKTKDETIKGLAAK